MNTDVVTNLQPQESASALVRKLGALSLLSEEEISFLEGLQNNTIDLEAGQDFIEDGSDLKTSFIIIDGWAVRYILLSDGRRQILSYALPGDILGLHVNFRSMATYSAASLTPLKLAAVDPRRILEISQKFPIIASALSWCTAREFAILGDQAVRLGRLSGVERVAHLLLELWQRLNLLEEGDERWLTLPMTQQDLADTLGLSVVYTNRCLKALMRKGLISATTSDVKLEKINDLIDLAQFDTNHLSKFSL